ncbi:unnamed protein product [Linum trigynum]|uniref:Uncharacterized protein n=1 Tax=Linum trigynum TaxID=586398 RepID=A0AAV2E6W8_9ROSI
MKTPHTCGRMSFARWMTIKTKQTGKEPDRLETFEDTHTRKNGTYVNEYATNLIEKAHTLRKEGSVDNEQIFQKLHGPEHSGRVRCTGLGPTPSTYFVPSSSSVSTNIALHRALLREKGPIEGSFRALSSSSQSVTRG